MDPTNPTPEAPTSSSSTSVTTAVAGDAGTTELELGPAPEPALPDSLLRRIEPEAARHLRVLGHHNAATIIERIAAEVAQLDEE